MNEITAPLAGKISGGHVLVQALKNKGIERIYSLCGGFLNPILIACQEHGIEVVTTRNEMEAGFMANATARTTRKVSVCLAEPSGFTNYISAVADAHFAGDPVIFIGVSANVKNSDNNGLKELPQPEVVRSMTKYAVEINDPTRIEWFLDKAFDIANNYPKGPVQLSIPTNFVFTGKVETPTDKGVRTFDKLRKKTHRPHPDPSDIEQLESMLAASVKPVIIAGGGVWYGKADKILEDFAAKNNIPIFTPFTHLKSVDMAHPMYMGLYDYHQNPCSRLPSAEADLILLLGGRLDFGLNYGEAPLIGSNTKLVCVNPTAQELSQNALADVRICSDISALLDCLDKRERIAAVSSDWVNRIRKSRFESLEPYRRFLESDQEPVHPLRLCYEVLMSLGEEDILVIDGGDISCWCETAFNFWAFEGRKIGGVIANGPWEHMGTGPAYATAVKMSNPHSRVTLITGDGALGLSPGLTPLETAIDREIPITVVVSNNAKWGMIYEQQSAMWGETYATSLRDVDYSKIFAASGAYAERITETCKIKGALKNASVINRNVPSFIEVKTSSVPSPITQGLVEMRVRTAIE